MKKEIVIDGVTYECTPKQEIKPIVYPDGTRVRSSGTGSEFLKINGEWVKFESFSLDEESIGGYYTVIHLPTPTSEFVLPDEWCVKGSSDMIKWQEKEMTNGCNVGFDSERFVYWPTCKDSLVFWDYEREDKNPYKRTVITFDQFYNHVYLPSLKK